MIAAASAANDNLIDALLLDLNGRTSIDTTNFTREPGETGAGNTNGRTAWFVWTAPEGTPTSVRFATYGSSYDTAINLYKRNSANPVAGIASLAAVSGAPENPVLVDDDAAISVTQGNVSWTPQTGTTYFISVGRNGGGGGATTLETTFGGVLAADGITSLVPNDNLAGALEFTATVTTPATQIWLTILANWPAPGAPTKVTARENAIATGCMAENGAASPPHITVSAPLTAPV